jgi:hypothetical protein
MVKPRNSSSVRLSSPLVPTKADELPIYLSEELPKLWNAIKLLSLGHIDKTYAAPDKPRDGDIRYADGTTWNPGSGIGIYYYKTNTWVLLG